MQQHWQRTKAAWQAPTVPPPSSAPPQTTYPADKDTAMFDDPQAGLLYSIPAVPSAITLTTFLGVIVHRIFLPDQPVFTPLLGQFFLAFSATSLLGPILVCTRRYTLCWRHRGGS